ncbi:hypothetical protein Tco_0039100 [Tanacetum coccineum]
MYYFLSVIAAYDLVVLIHKARAGWVVLGAGAGLSMRASMDAVIGGSSLTVFVPSGVVSEKNGTWSEVPQKRQPELDAAPPPPRP